MKIKVVDNLGKQTSELEIAGIETEINPSHSSAILYFLQNNARTSVAHTKDRGEVTGSGIKPWRQKGTGRARAGSRRSPIWRGGGVTFGPRNTDNFATSLPKKMRKSATYGMLMEKLKSGKVTVVDQFAFNKKTKSGLEFLAALRLDHYPVSLIVDENDTDTKTSTRNLANVRLVSLNKFHAGIIFGEDHLIFNRKAFVGLFKEGTVKEITKKSDEIIKKKSNANKTPEKTVKDNE